MLKIIGRGILPAMLVLALSGCVTAAIQGASRAGDQAEIAANKEAANAGDAAAELKLGKAHCCSIAGSMGVLNNQDATHWFCKAAAQNNAEAQYELGRIYSGDLVRGPNGPAKIGSLIADIPENDPLALMWLDLAAANGDKDATDKAKDVAKDMTPEDIAKAKTWQANPQAQPCEWNDVYPDRKI